MRENEEFKITKGKFEKLMNEYAQSHLKVKEDKYKREKLKYQLFIGKVSEIIGYEKTIELLRESKKAIDNTKL
jgi:hypothetical protein